MASRPAGRRSRTPVTWDTGWGSPPVESQAEASQIVRQKLENGMVEAGNTFEDLKATVQAAVSNPQSQAEATTRMLQSRVRAPMDNSRQAAEDSASGAARALEAAIQQRSAEAFQTASPLQPRVPTMETAMSAALGVDPAYLQDAAFPPPARANAPPGYIQPGQTPADWGDGPVYDPGSPELNPPGNLPAPVPIRPLPPGDGKLLPPPKPPGQGMPPWMPPAPPSPPPSSPEPRPMPPDDTPVPVGESCKGTGDYVARPHTGGPVYVDWETFHNSMPGGGCAPGYRVVGYPERPRYPGEGWPDNASWWTKNDDGTFYVSKTFLCERCAPDDAAPPPPTPLPPPPPPPPTPERPRPPECPPCPEPTPEKPRDDEREIKAAKCVNLPTARLIGPGTLAFALSWLIGVTDKDGKPVTPPFLRMLNLFGLPLGDGIATLLRSVESVSFVKWSSLLARLQCGGTQQLDLQGELAAYHFVERWTGIIPRPVYRPVVQQSQYLCPTELPSAPEADAMRLADTITEEEWRCYVRADNSKDDLREALFKAKRSRLTALDYLNLLRRKRISAKEYVDAIRSLGFTDDVVSEQIEQLGQQLPALGDIIRFLTRDVADEQLVGRFGMDEDFDKKWAGPLIEWADAQGVPKAVARAAWRAHWTIPAPGQLYEMYHRFGRLNPADERYTSLDDVKTALQQQDILPYWIPKLMGAAQHQINPSDAYKARQVGTIQRFELVEILEQNGYSHDDAERVADSWEAQILLQHERLPMCRLYLQWAASKMQVVSVLMEKGLQEQDIDTVLHRLSTRREALRRRACQRGQKKRFMAGEWTVEEAVQYLIVDGLDPETADELVRVWQCEIRSKGKVFSAAMLCRLLDAGLITTADYLQRLLNMGWGAEEAELIVAQCSRRVAFRQNELERKAYEKALREAKAAADRTSKAEKARQADIAKQAAKIQKCNDAKEAAERNILTASEAMKAKVDSELYDAIKHIKDLIRSLVLEAPSDRISLAAACPAIAKGAAGKDWTGFDADLTAYAYSGVHRTASCDDSVTDIPDLAYPPVSD